MIEVKDRTAAETRFEARGIIGYERKTITDRDRVCVPIFTGYQEKQILVFVNYGHPTFIGLEDYDTRMYDLDRRFKELEDKAKVVDPKIAKQYRESFMANYFMMENKVSPDSQRRIVLPGEVLSRFKKRENFVLFNGYYSGVALFFSEDDRLDYINKNKNLAFSK